MSRRWRLTIAALVIAFVVGLVGLIAAEGDRPPVRSSSANSSTSAQEPAPTDSPTSTDGPTATGPPAPEPTEPPATDAPTTPPTVAPTTTVEPLLTPEFAPWDGALGYYEANGFTNSFGDLGDDFFPISWFGAHGDNPDNLARHRDLHFNTLVAVNTNQADLANIRAAGLHAVVAMQDELLALSEADLEVVKAWYILDEPDNSSAGDRQCTTPQRLAEMTERVRRTDPSRPRMVIFGDGLAIGPPVTDNAWYIGRGDCFARDDHYRSYILAEEFQSELPGAGVEIVSFDHYGLGQTGGNPVSRTPDGLSEDDKVVGPDALHAVPEGRERAYGLVPEIRNRPFWQVVEAVPFTGEYGVAPTAAQMRFQVWSSIIHGATGIVWWDLQMRPLYDSRLVIGDEQRSQDVAQINREVLDLASVLNGSPPVTNGATVSTTGAPVDILVKFAGNSLYVFAAAMRNEPSVATFTLPEIGTATVEVLGEGGRTIDVVDGQFTDEFGGYRVHIYKITATG